MRKNDRGTRRPASRFEIGRFNTVENGGHPGDAFAPLPEAFSPAIWASF